jgi:hypothetical protein
LLLANKGLLKIRHYKHDALKAGIQLTIILDAKMKKKIRMTKGSFIQKPHPVKVRLLLFFEAGLFNKKQPGYL